MNYQTAAVVGGAAFLLSALAGLIGGVPLFDLVVRALFWGALGFGASLGVETLLRSLMPDLFTAARTDDPAREPESPRQVDITLEDEPRGGVFEEVDDEEPAFVARRQSTAPASEPSAPEAPAEGRAAEERAEEPEEEMPEIGAFLDAFKPSGGEGEEAADGPELAEYTPVEAPERRSSREVKMDGEEQDPVILAKAIQTVMKRDGQGN